MFGKIEKEEEAKKLEAQERRAANAPPPGAKPKRARKEPAAASTDGVADMDSAATELGTDGKADGSNANEPSADGAARDRAPRPGSTPRPGARPKKRKR